jgi:hypothetical protein
MRVLEQLRMRSLFGIKIVTIPSGGDYRPVSQLWGRTKVTAPKRIACITELCDQYYQAHLDARELEALANDILKLSHKLRSQT